MQAGAQLVSQPPAPEGLERRASDYLTLRLIQDEFNTTGSSGLYGASICVPRARDEITWNLMELVRQIGTLGP